MDMLSIFKYIFLSELIDVCTHAQCLLAAEEAGKGTQPSRGKWDPRKVNRRAFYSLSFFYPVHRGHIRITKSFLVYILNILYTCQNRRVCLILCPHHSIRTTITIGLSRLHLLLSFFLVRFSCWRILRPPLDTPPHQDRMDVIKAAKRNKA